VEDGKGGRTCQEKAISFKQGDAAATESTEGIYRNGFGKKKKRKRKRREKSKRREKRD